MEAELQQFLLDLEDKQFPMPADVPEDVAESLVEEDADFNAEVMDVQASLCDAAPTVYLEADKVAGRGNATLDLRCDSCAGPRKQVFVRQASVQGLLSLRVGSDSAVAFVSPV